MASVGADPGITRAEPRPHAPSAPRTDIQALRAFAVAAVVLFHVWPLAITGGYVGVDVFFVISGYLITGQLVRLRAQGTLRLGAFWAARARRLLPAALLVLLASTALTLAFAPASLVTQYLRSIVGSTLYVENWVLAADAVDYLGADNAPPIAQHYWSLSVEEQFYVLWPLLILLMTSAAIVRRVGRSSLLASVVIISGLSLLLSLVTTFTAPSFAYFATPVRMWEFGFGAVVAILPTLLIAPATRTAIWLVSWTGLLYSAFFFNAETPFPGMAAILPVTATAALIWIGPEPPFRLASAAQWRPIQWIGDNSYGIYLWHWPLIVIAPAIVADDLELWQNVSLVILTVALAALGKRFVEDPVRYGRLARARPRTVLLLAASGMVVVLAAAGLPGIVITTSVQAQTAQAREDVLDPDSCRGANALLNSECDKERDLTTGADQLIPSLAGLYDDTDGAFACYQSEQARIEPCRIGSNAPDATRIALTGDSHAAMLIPGLRDVAVAENWAIDVYVGRGCVWSADSDPTCSDRQAALDSDLLSNDYSAILVTAWNQPDASAQIREERATEYAARWRTAIDNGIMVIPILDNPSVPQSSADCLASTSSFSRETCSFQRSDTGLEDPLEIATRQVGAESVDLRSAYCDSTGTCPMVLGGVVVYRDLHHITATFSHSLAVYLAEDVSRVLAASTSPRP